MSAPGAEVAAAAAAAADDPLYQQAVQLAHERRRLTHAVVQRALFIGFNRASHLLEAMEQRGVVRCIPTKQGGHWQLVT
jgi:DNA segregation ATPase FtsK/SpoIIIE-like protein